MSSLLPCPFCGGEARIMKISGSGGGTGYAVGCGRPFCPTEGAVTRWFVDEGLAAKAWNTRHVETCQIANKGEPEYDVITRDYEFSCGHTIAWGHTYEPSYCPNCGRKVEQ